MTPLPDEETPMNWSEANDYETGLDHYQVRRFDAWHRHVTLAMLAHAHLAVAEAVRQRPV